MRMFVLTFSSLVLLSSCGKSISISGYTEYKKSHIEMFQLEEGTNPKLQLSLVTPEQIVVDNSAELAVEELRKEYETMRNQELASFNLKISTDRSFINETKGSKTEQTRYYSVDFKKNIHAVTSVNDTLDCTGYLFQAGSGMGNSGYFEFQFNKTVRELKEIFVSSPYLGDSVFKFNLQQFHNNYPSLKIK